MLQQTQVKTVIPYWERWMRELPTIESLAHASADKIHKLWEGLGYYTRVRNMQKAAQQIMASQSAVAADVSPLHLKSGRSKSRLTSAATIKGSMHLLSRPAATLSSIQNGGEGRGEEALGFGERDGARGFPTNFDAVLALPGIGRYTAGAICSIAFNQPTPILDGNVIRVLTRVYGITTDPRKKQTNAQLWSLAEQLVTTAKGFENPTGMSWTAAGSEAPRRFRNASDASKAVSPPRSATALQNSCSHLNQSLMELGALLCTPRSPNCPACPVKNLCVAQKENLQEQLPNLGKRAATTARRFIAFIVERGGKFLVRQRPAGVVNAHLWEFPNVEALGAPSSRRRVSDSNSEQHAGKRPALPDGNFCPTSAKPLCTIKHSITRYRITLEAWRANLASANGAPVSDPARSKSTLTNTPGRRPALRGEWRTLNQLHQLAFTSAHKKILAELEERG